MVMSKAVVSFFTLCLLVKLVLSKNFKAHIVESPSNYGFQQQYANAIPGASPFRLKRQPAPFFGPKAFKSLNHNCFSLEKGQYEWKLCPFHNATQEETGTRWNPYRGVLGVWSGWKVDITNNAFKSMLMTDGDDCGSTGPRQVEVNLICGSKNSLVAVDEPSTCHYSMTLESPALCSEKNLRVYPNLNADFKKEWDRAFTEWESGLLTTKGYIRAVKDVLARSGVISKSDISGSSETNNSSKANAIEPHAETLGVRERFGARENSMTKCNQDYKDLLAKYEKLGRQHAEAILELSQCKNNYRLRFGGESSNSEENPKRDLLNSVDD